MKKQTTFYVSHGGSLRVKANFLKFSFLLLLCSTFWTTVNAQCNPSATKCDDFEKYSLGLLDPQSTDWEVWAGAEDVNVTNTYSSSGTKSISINAPGQDIIYKTGTLSKGIQEVNWKMYVPLGETAYTGLLHTVFSSGINTAGAELYFRNNQTVDLYVDGFLENTFSFSASSWLNVSYKIDFAKDSAYLSINNVKLAGFPFSTSGLKTLEGVDFWGGTVSFPRKFYVDDVQLINRSTPTGKSSVTFNVNMQDQNNVSAVYLAGSFNAWNTTSLPMTKVAGTSTWTKTIELKTDSLYEYKFINGTTYEIITGACTAANGNRTVKANTDISLPNVCFKSCTACAKPAFICNPKAIKCDAFDNYTAGGINAQSTDWELTPITGALDANVSTNQSNSGANSLHLNNIDQNVMFKLGKFTDGAYELKFKAFIPTGKTGYVSVLKDATSSDIAFDLFFRTGQYVSLWVEGDLIDLVDFENDKWLDISIKIDLDNNKGIFKVDSELPLDFTYSSSSTKKFGAVTFWGGNSSDTRDFYVDDIELINNATDKVNTTFSVNMKNETNVNTVYLAGSFNGWNKTALPMTKIAGTSVWTTTIELKKDSTYEYKFLNGATYEIVTGTCKAANGNRTIKLGKTNTTLPRVCFKACENCAAPALVCHPRAVKCDDFEKYNLGLLDAQSTDWIASSSASDIEITSDEFSSGKHSMQFKGTEEDIYFQTGTINKGVYEVRSKLYIPNGQSAYAALVQNLDLVDGSDYATELYFRTSGEVAIYDHNTLLTTLPYTYDKWLELSFQIDFTKDLLSIYLDNTLLQSFKFSSSSGLKDLVAVNFWGGFSDTPRLFYVDDVQLINLTPSNITFVVDLSKEATVSTKGVHLAGNFQKAIGLATDWDPAATIMKDNGKKVWSITLPIPPGTYEFKYVNGDTWGTDEKIIGTCAAPNSTNRKLTVTTNDSKLDTVCFNLCVKCNKVGTADVIEQEVFKVIPNPTSDVFTISFDENNHAEPEQVQITSLDGRVLYMRNMQNANLTIEDHNLVSGVYFVKLTLKDRRQLMSKLVIQK